MTRTIVGLTLLLFLSPPARADQADDLCQRGQALLQQGQYQQAIAAFSAALRLNGQLADAYVGRGKAYGYAGQPQKSLDDATAALQIQPSASAYIVSEVAHFDLKQFSAAYGDLAAGLKLDPNNAVLWSNLGTLCHEFGRYGQAVAAYNRAIRLAPNWPMPKQERRKSIQAHQDVLTGKLRPPAGDLPQLAAHGPKRGAPLDFWSSVGTKDVLIMTKEEREGDRKVITTVKMDTIRVEVPRKQLPITVYFPLQKGDIYRPTLNISAPPGLVILGEYKDPFGVLGNYVKLYLDWLYFKSGLPK